MNRLRDRRLEAGLTQGELAARAGVSRQLVGAVEAGRHLPRVDAALSLAMALGVEVSALFGAQDPPVDVITGDVPADGDLVRVGRVGDRVVTSKARVGSDGYDVADAIVERGTVAPLGRVPPGLVVAGCEPGLELLERLLRERGMGAVSVAASNATALGALNEGRTHAVVVHGSPERLATLAAGADVERFRLCRWQVGLAASDDAGGDWWRTALSGRARVVQRDGGAGVQQVFEEARGPGTGHVDGPRVSGHLEAARWASIAGLAAVTIEPAALAVGAAFHPLAEHEAQLWSSTRWVRQSPVDEALDVIAGARFRRRLDGVGGYDLAGIGTRVA